MGSDYLVGYGGEIVGEEPVHTVFLDAYWIDRTEVTNTMYGLCVDAGKCEEPDKRAPKRKDLTTAILIMQTTQLSIYLIMMPNNIATGLAGVYLPKQSGRKQLVNC